MQRQDETILTFGKYKGEVISEVNDLNYLCMVLQHSWKGVTKEVRALVRKRVNELIEYN